MAHVPVRPRPLGNRVQLDFPDGFFFALFASLAFPVTLMLAGLHADLRADNAKRFFLAASAHTAALAAATWARGGGEETWLLGALMWAIILLLYLEIWALLSRGYTLAMLLSLLDTSTPLSADEIARRYRGGAGLAWIMEHRAGGLEAARLIRRQGGQIRLTVRGAVVARASLAARTMLGLSRGG